MASPASVPAVSILIVSWNSRDLLARCLESLTPLPHQVIVVDNASEDGSADMIARTFPAVTLVRETTNLGFAGGMNRARREARAARLLLLNPDTTATAAPIDALVATLDTAASSKDSVDIAPASRAATTQATQPIGAVGGRLVSPDGTPQTGFNVRRFPTLGSFAMDLLLVDKIWRDNPVTRRYLAADLDADAAADVDQPAAACLMIRADVFDAIGGMDERFHPAWFEDVDICRRIRAAGYRIRYEPRASFVHHGGVAMRTLGLGRFSSIWYRNMERYARKHHGVAGWLTIKLLIAVGMTMRAAISVARGDTGAAGAYMTVLRQTLTHWSVAG
jgi:GT2 family glycosyltransferase